MMVAFALRLVPPSVGLITSNKPGRQRGLWPILFGVILPLIVAWAVLGPSSIASSGRVRHGLVLPAAVPPHQAS